MAKLTREAKLGLVEFGIENLGTEIWLVEHPVAAQEAWDAAVDLDLTGERCPLDEAARAGGAAIVLRAHWGNDIPSEDRESWLCELLPRIEESDREMVRALVEDSD